MVGKIFVVSAPSGAGKTTLVTELVSRYPGKLERVVTYTTREPRYNEIDGVDYCFISVKEFEEKITQGFFIEWSTAYGTYYGSPVSLLEKAEKGTSSIIILDWEGARRFFEVVPQAVGVWITVSHPHVLFERLLKRGTETAESRDKRFARACLELEQEKKKLLFKNVVINDELCRSIQCFEQIVMGEFEQKI